MRILISGASGLIGSALSRQLTADGHQLLTLVRRKARTPDEISWYPQDQTIDRERLEGLDAVIHLAGENIASGRWTPALKQRIRDSRVEGTGLLAEALCRLDQPPEVLISASAVGYYGDRGAQLLDEAEGPGQGFLSEVCQAWEAAAQPVRDRGIRLVSPRIATVISHQGGALPPMLIPFRLGLGGRLGSGEQYMSWIALADLVQALRFCLQPGISGPVNCCAPEPVSNRAFTRELARQLHRPALFPVPAPLLRLALGSEMAQGLLLDSTRAVPARLQAAGFSFRYGRLEAALAAALAGA